MRQAKLKPAKQPASIIPVRTTKKVNRVAPGSLPILVFFVLTLLLNYLIKFSYSIVMMSENPVMSKISLTSLQRLQTANASPFPIAFLAWVAYRPDSSWYPGYTVRVRRDNRLDSKWAVWP